MTPLSEDEEEIASVIRAEADDVLKRGEGDA
jgi:hypothetical protein